MKIILTGATGFLGSAIKNHFINEDIITVGRKHCDVIAHLEQDIPVLPAADLVIHAAGKAHSVPKNDEEEKEFYDVNVKGTENLLQGLNHSYNLPKSFVFISSIAVYGAEEGFLLDETTPLLANDAYGKSKIEAEKLVLEWCRSNNVTCAILRLPLLAGSNPPGNLGAMVKAVKKGYYFNIAGGKAKKSIARREDVASVILVASKKGGIFNLTDGYHPSFNELSEIISKQLKKAKPLNIPLWLAKLMAFGGDFIGNKAPINTKKLRKITKDLTFADEKARTVLGWKPETVLAAFKI